MASELYNIIEGVSREKGIDPQIVVSAVEDAIVVATRKFYKTQENLRAVLDKDSGKINAYAVKSIVENPEQVEDPNLQVTVEQAKKLDPTAEAGGELLIPKATEGILGRIAAQLAKQVIFQKVREAERDTVYNEYIGHVNEIVNATVKRLEGPDVILDIGKAEARMGRKEQSRLESFAVGERIRVVIVRVEKATKGPGVIASRSAPELVQHLFQTEVPEIYDGTVVIRAIAREAGERTKIAVMSKDKDVDAVGACVGMKGMRVQSIIRELHGEKIDIIEYHEVAVDDSQLSLAIGKKGQNVRLAAKLLGWKIDIKSEEEKRQEVEQQMADMVPQTATPLEKVPGLGEGLVEKLGAAGVTTVEALADMTREQLEAIEGIGPKTVEKISLAVNNYFASLEGAAVEGAAEGEVAAEGEAAAAEPSEPELSEAGGEDITAEVPVATEEAASADETAASAEVASTEEGTVEAETLAADENEGQAERSGEQAAPEEEAASETRE